MKLKTIFPKTYLFQEKIPTKALIIFFVFLIGGIFTTIVTIITAIIGFSFYLIYLGINFLDKKNKLYS